MLLIKSCCIQLQQQILIQNLNFEIENNQVLTLMGPSGSGKSTILNWIIGCLQKPFTATGEIWLHGKRLDLLPTEQRRIGILFQDDFLFPHLSVGKNLMLALPRNKSKQECKELVLQTLANVELDGLYDRDPSTLSGGQKARISLLRALLAKPDALLLDEPFSKLDQKLRIKFKEFVFDIVDKEKIPVLMVTHDQQDIPENGAVILLN